MSAIRGTIRNGKVELDEPTDLPDGTEVKVELVDPECDPPPDEDESPEAIGRRLALMDRFGPWMTDEEFAAWERARAENKAFQLSQWEKQCREADELWG